MRSMGLPTVATHAPTTDQEIRYEVFSEKSLHENDIRSDVFGEGVPYFSNDNYNTLWDSESRGWVALAICGGKVVGAYKWHRMPDYQGFLGAVRPVYSVAYVGVHPEFRRRGVARSLADLFFETVGMGPGNLIVLSGHRPDGVLFSSSYFREGFHLMSEDLYRDPPRADPERISVYFQDGYNFPQFFPA